MKPDESIRAVLNSHWVASADGDLEAEYAIYRDDAICEYPQSGERIVGKRNIQALRGHHPGKPSGFKVRRMVGVGNLWVTEYAIIYEGNLVPTVSIMEFQDGQVVRETQYFSTPFAAPDWRKQWIERME